jgi:hypothetical protein
MAIGAKASTRTLGWAGIVVAVGLAGCRGAATAPAGTAVPVAGEAAGAATGPAPAAPRTWTGAGPTLVYARGSHQRGGEIVAAPASGSAPRVLARLADFSAVLDAADVHRTSATVLFGPDSVGLAVWRPGEAGRSSGAAQAVSGTAAAWHPRISPDGRTAAYTRFVPEGSGRRIELHLVDLETGGERMVAGDLRPAETGANPRVIGWSRDGRQVYVDLACDCGLPPHDLYVVDVVGAAVVRRHGFDGPRGDTTLAPDGRRLAYTTVAWAADEVGGPCPGRSNRLEVRDLDGSAAAKVLAEGGGRLLSDALWAPDGSRVAYRSADGAGGDGLSVAAANVVDGTTTVLLATGAAADLGDLRPVAWLPGDVLAYTSEDRAGGTALWLQELDGNVWREVDRAPEIAVLGWFERQTTVRRPSRRPPGAGMPASRRPARLDERP